MTPARWVVLWRDTPSANARLRTYTETSLVLSYLIEDLAPTPAHLITLTDQLDRYLSSADTTPVAVLSELAESQLGWRTVPA